MQSFLLQKGFPFFIFLINFVLPFLLRFQFLELFLLLKNTDEDPVPFNEVGSGHLIILVVYVGIRHAVGVHRQLKLLPPLD